jgi:hypothetical protein
MELASKAKGSGETEPAPEAKGSGETEPVPEPRGVGRDGDRARAREVWAFALFLFAIFIPLIWVSHFMVPNKLVLTE